MRVAYLGPPGTVSDEALTAAAPDAEPVPLATLRDVVLSVQEGRVERALAPVENALEGGVDPVLDALALEAPDVALIGEVVQPVSYCLAAGRELRWTRSRWSSRTRRRWGSARAGWRSTFPAPRSFRPRRPPTRCARSPRTASAPTPRSARASPPRRYGAVMLAEGIEDDPGNATRFAWLARAEAAPPPPETGAAKTDPRLLGHGLRRAPAGSSPASRCSRSPAST